AHPADGHAVTAWLDHRADPIGSIDPASSLDDLDALGHIARRAEVVGLGEWSHGSREQCLVKHKMVRYLVERMGFRTLAFEMDFAQGAAIDRFVLTGEGDARELATDLSSQLWETQEILDVIEWMRERNEAHPGDEVRFLGADLLTLREASFTALTDYVGAAAPERLEELAGHLDPIRPTGDGHIWWYQEELDDAERAAFIAHAHAALDLVEGIPGDGLEREYADRHARTVVGWHEYYAILGAAPRPGRERFIADTLEWWQRLVGGRTAYWAANIHTCAAPSIAYELPGESTEFTYAGGHLRERLGGGYVSIGTISHEGAVNSGWHPVAPVDVAPPGEGLLDAVLGEAREADYLIDLHARAPRPVREWREAPATTRMIHPVYGEGQSADDHAMTTGSLIETFDAIVHIRRTTPNTLLS
ncbi:erythromycin esterase family protein, partial [Glycomyces tenuis]|uniref:erythromycin esterase family protein n=1 Tax=Glycomyces tenuis TaxID=58116 RepID=UPI00054D0501